MNAPAWVSMVAGSPAPALACLAVGLFASFGLGRIILALLGLEFRHPGFRAIASLALGLDVFAFATAALSLTQTPQLPINMVLTASAPLAIYGLYLAATGLSGTFSHFARMKCLPLCLPLLPALLYLGAALCPPSGWDELVYQLAVPERWNVTGLAGVSPDLPYSAFPSLPQFLYWPLIGTGGAIAAKLLAFTVFLLMAVAVFHLCRLKASAFASAALTAAFLVAPTLSFVGKEAYAEQFIVFNLLAALLLLKGLKRGKSQNSLLVCGILGGACAAVKLTGASATIALLAILALRRGVSMKNLALFVCATALFAAPFYARPALATGNPLHPYFSGVFAKADAATMESSQFHHATGSARFGADGLPGLLTSPLLLSMPFAPFDAVCDGSYGFQLLGLLALALLAAALRKRAGERFKAADFAIPVAILLLYIFWFASARQARFLLPGFALVCILAASAMPFLRGRMKLYIPLALLALAVMSFQLPALRHCLISWRSLTNPGGQANMVYSGTGGDYLPSIDAMLGNTSKNSKTLLLFEERTLYMPGACEIGTPFFQAARLTPPDKIDAKELEDVLMKGSFTHVYLRAPENCPDLVKSYFERCAPLSAAVAALETKGVLKELWRSGTVAIYGFVPGKD